MMRSTSAMTTAHKSRPLPRRKNVWPGTMPDLRLAKYKSRPLQLHHSDGLRPRDSFGHRHPNCEQPSTLSECRSQPRGRIRDIEIPEISQETVAQVYNPVADPLGAGPVSRGLLFESRQRWLRCSACDHRQVKRLPVRTFSRGRSGQAVSRFIRPLSLKVV